MPGGRRKGDGLGKTGGRKKGTPNKMTHQRKEMIRTFIEGRWEDFEKAYDSLDDPAKKCSLMIDLLPFAVPRLASIEYKDKNQPKTLKDELDEISGEKSR